MERVLLGTSGEGPTEGGKLVGSADSGPGAPSRCTLHAVPVCASCDLCMCIERFYNGENAKCLTGKPWSFLPNGPGLDGWEAASVAHFQEAPSRGPGGKTGISAGLVPHSFHTSPLTDLPSGCLGAVAAALPSPSRMASGCRANPVSGSHGLHLLGWCSPEGKSGFWGRRYRSGAGGPGSHRFSLTNASLGVSPPPGLLCQQGLSGQHFYPEGWPLGGPQKGEKKPVAT